MGISERKEREKEQRRTDILDAAEKVFFRKGVEHTTMDEVAEEAELSKGTLYIYFKSKEEMLYAIHLRAMKIMKNLFVTAIDPSKNTLDNIIEVGRMFIRFSREYSDYFKILIFFEGSEYYNPGHDLYKMMCGHDDDPMLLFIEMLNTGMKDGSVRTDIPPAILAHTLWSQTTGILKLAKTKEYHIDLQGTTEDDIINAHIKILLNGIKNEK